MIFAAEEEQFVAVRYCVISFDGVLSGVGVLSVGGKGVDLGGVVFRVSIQSLMELCVGAGESIFGGVVASRVPVGVTGSEE